MGGDSELRVEATVKFKSAHRIVHTNEGIKTEDKGEEVPDVLFDDS